MSLDDQLIGLIDQRVRLHQVRGEALGTCVGRDIAGPGADVLFDGATVAVPVKVWGHVVLRPGMRCGLRKYGTEWIVEGAFATPAMGRAEIFTTATATSCGSTSYIDMAGLPTVEFTKLHENTWIDIDMSAMAFVNTAGQGSRFAVRLIQLEGDTPYTPVDLDGPIIFFSQVAHLGGSARYARSGVPAGRYTVQPRWRRTSGTVNIQANTEDLFHFILNEVVMSTSPYV